MATEGGVKTGYCTEPCSGCPWRIDTAMSIVPQAEDLCGSRENTLRPGTPMMPCHKTPPDADQNICAGWLALYGNYHLGVRLMIGCGAFPLSVLEVDPAWPPLHPDVQSIIEAHG